MSRFDISSAEENVKKLTDKIAKQIRNVRNTRDTTRNWPARQLQGECRRERRKLTAKTVEQIRDNKRHHQERQEAAQRKICLQRYQTRQVRVCETRLDFLDGCQYLARPCRVPRRSHRLGILYPTRRLSRALLGYTSDVFSVG